MTFLRLSRISLFARTVRHLKFLQVSSRVIRRAVPPHIRTTKRKISVRPNVHFKPSVARLLTPGAEWARGDADWRSNDKPKLWRYNLHYFDYLRDEGRSKESRLGLINNWIECNPPGMPDAWEPFPVSLRIVNWIRFLNQPENRDFIKPRWLESLYGQMLWLERNVEYHLLANHYFKNGKALIFGGLFFAGADADRWLRKGLRIISAELDEQILPDGGHFERSPMYHSMVLEDCLDLYNICRSQEDAALQRLTQRLRMKTRDMIRFLLGMTHPDGRIALFNDAAFGIEAEPAELAGYYELLTGEKAGHPSGTSWSFPDTGYYVMAPETGTRLLIDCGRVGPDYQPGHSHCDTLSFELSVKGKRVIVDSGCFEYDDGEVRRYNRGIAGHNSVTIDGQNQSEVWGAHRCARRAYPMYAGLEKKDNGIVIFKGAHDGYCRLPGKPLHHRAIASKGSSFVIDDRVEGKGRHDLEWRLHIHPALSVQIDDCSAAVRAGSELLATIYRNDGGRIERTNGWYCPEFGLKQACVVLSYSCKNATLPSMGGWTIKLK